MKWNQLKQNKYWKVFTNKYVLISIIFVIWILFLDANAWLISHRELDQQIVEKEQNVDFYKRGIQKDQNRIKALKDSAGIEKFARERYLMKRENEEVFIIQHADSLKKDTNE
ncbi:FtsB family cell division protein [Nonlabens ulvanivorans]|uniref:Septum formation initiator n=1 Tax=Nonlabens ulvanivorans TaxID=906888 RepID=A0A084JZW9_NONUL|nr:septum formation initiator family protein [Nonlabens ulvanivorans]KEZ94503.1 septum formation initiator [Nonlabens ulvanivorans]PRX13461.1 septum formation initiator [Nonlabens ulvanivorans]